MERQEVIEILTFLFQENQDSTMIQKMIHSAKTISDEELKRKTMGFTRTSLINYIRGKVQAERQHEDISGQRINVNDYFDYGISGDTVHIHLPKDLHEEFQQLGKKKAIAQIGLYLIDAVNRINCDRNQNRNDLEKCRLLYMISPIFYSGGFYPSPLRKKMTNEISIESPILWILKRFGLEVKTISEQDLHDKEKIANDPEVQLALKNFGDKKDVGVARITFDELNSKKWQKKLIRVEKLLRKYLKLEEKQPEL